MGNCCKYNKIEEEEIEITYDEIYYLREKIYKVFRTNAFHNIGSRRQSLIEKEYISYYTKNESSNKFNIIKFLNKQTKLFDKDDCELIFKIYVKVSDKLSFFPNYDQLFLNILLFVLSNTKNNLDKKQEIIIDMINHSFFISNNDVNNKIDINKLKKLIQAMTKICIEIFMIFIILKVFCDKENLTELIKNNTKINELYDFYNIHEFILLNINKEIKKNYSYKKLLEKWEDHLLTPIIFAGYSNEKNIANYNLKLKDEIISRLINLFDADKIITSFCKLQIE